MRHVVTTSLSSSVGLLAIFAVDFVDMFFIALLGNPALAAAVGYAGIMLFFTTSINIGLSIAAGVFVARALGADEAEKARAYAGSVLGLALLLTALIAGAMLATMPTLLGWLGAEGKTMLLALSYLQIVTPTMPLMSAVFVALAVLRAHGYATLAMSATIVGGVVNAVLDPIFIFGFDWGLDGAAWASVAARCSILAFALWPIIRSHKSIALPSFSGLRRDSWQILALAVPAILTNLATPVGSAIITREMASYGSDAIAGVAIITRLTPLVFALVYALSGAVGPVVGQNFGARYYHRVRATVLASLKFVSLYVCAVALLLYLLRPYIAALFDASGLTRELVYLFCGPLALGFIFTAALFVANATFNNIGHPLYATWLNWGRHTLGTWPPALAGAAIWGAPGILIGQTLGGLVFGIIAVWLSYYSINSGGGDATKHRFSRHAAMHWLFGTRHHC